VNEGARQVGTQTRKRYSKEKTKGCGERKEKKERNQGVKRFASEGLYRNTTRASHAVPNESTQNHIRSQTRLKMAGEEDRRGKRTRREIDLNLLLLDQRRHFLQESIPPNSSHCRR